MSALCQDCGAPTTASTSWNVRNRYNITHEVCRTCYDATRLDVSGQPPLSHVVCNITRQGFYPQ